MQNNKLTPREREILELRAWGASLKEIAYQLNISYNTVDVHFKNIKQKTGLQKANELAALYFANSYHIPLIDIPGAIRKTLAAAMLTLSIYTAILNTTEMVRTMRPARTTRTASRGRRSRRDSDLEIEFIPLDSDLEKLQFTA